MEVKVKARRTELGMTQAQLAREAKVGQHTISDIETGVHIPKVDVAILVSQALGKPVEELFLVDKNGKAHPLR